MAEKITFEEAMANYKAAVAEMDEEQATIEEASGRLSAAAEKRDAAEAVLEGLDDPRLSAEDAYNEAHA